MKRYFSLLFALSILIGCTKNSANGKQSGLSTPEKSSANVLSSSVSNSEGPRQLLTQKSLESEGADSLSSAAFNSVCPTTTTLMDNVKKYLYYLVGNDIYQIGFPEKVKKIIYSIPKERMIEGKNSEMIKVSAGHVIWQTGGKEFSEKQKLFIWDGAKTYAIRLDQNPLWQTIADNFESPNFAVTSFLISTNGGCIVWNTNGIAGYSDDPSERVPDSEYMKNIVYASRIGSEDQKEVLRQSYLSHYYHDNTFKKELLSWSKINPSKVYLTTKFETQHDTGHSGVVSIDFKSGQEKIIADVEEFLAFSPDEKKIAYSPNEEVGDEDSDLTNSTVIIKDIESGDHTIVYDEWKEFRNEGKNEEYYPFKAAFSPDGALIAISIRGSKRFATIRKTDGTGILFNLPDRFVIGWLDNSTLILGKKTTNFDERNEVENIYVYNLKSQKEESLSLTDVVYLGFE